MYFENIRQQLIKLIECRFENINKKYLDYNLVYNKKISINKKVILFKKSLKINSVSFLIALFNILSNKNLGRKRKSLLLRFRFNPILACSK